MSRLSLLTATCALVLSCGISFAASDRYIVWGAGHDSCGRFVQEQVKKSRRYYAQISWIAGFTSAGSGEWRAVAAKAGFDSDLLKGTDFAALETWLVNYCKANPLENLGRAAVELQKKLLERVSGTKR